MRVDFMIIGAQKCGTTTLFTYLENHPQTNGCRIKEPHFFSSTKDWRSELSRYHGLFDEGGGGLYFEASTSYTFYPLRNLSIWDDIFAYNPNMKFIYIVRNPFDRIVSGYVHTYERGYTDLSLEHAIVSDRMYVDLTRYYTQVAPYIRTFGRDRVLILDFDDLIDNTAIVLGSIAEFLSIEKEGFRDVGHVHKLRSFGGEQKRHYKHDNPGPVLRAIRRYSPRLWDRFTDNSGRTIRERPALVKEYRSMVSNLLRLEVREIGKLMNKDLTGWLS